MCRNRLMQKFVAGVMTAAMVLSIGSVSAFAASTDTGNNNGEVPIDPIVVQNPEETDAVGNVESISEGYEISAPTEAETNEAQIAAQDVVNAAGDVNAETIATVNVDATTATQDGEGNYNYTLDVNGVNAGDQIVALLFDGTNWITVYPTVVGDGFLTFSTNVLGTLHIMKLTARTQVAGASRDNISGGSSSGSSSSASSSNAGGAVLGATRANDAAAAVPAVDLGGQVLGAGRSPKTADNGNGLLVMLAVLSFAGAGALVYTGKRRA